MKRLSFAIVFACCMLTVAAQEDGLNVLLHIGYETGQDNYAFKCQTDNVC